MNPIFYIAIAAIGILALYVVAPATALGDTSAVRKAAIAVSNKAHFHQMMGIIILVAHASEIGRVVAHISWMHLLIALFLFALWFATRYDDAEEFG